MFLNTQKDVWYPSKRDQSIATHLAQFCNNLYNVGTYQSRQHFFATGKFLSYPKLWNICKSNDNVPFVYSQVAQQTIMSVAEAFSSFKSLQKLKQQGKLDQNPRLPNYQKKGGMYQIAYPGQALKKMKLKNGGCVIRVPLGSEWKQQTGADAFYVPLPERLIKANIRELRLIPKAGMWYIEYVYDALEYANQCRLNNDALGIDPGVTNLVTCVSTKGHSFIFNGRRLKSVNQWYNKRRSKLQGITDKQTGKTGFQTQQMLRLTERRNRQMRDAINKVARQIITYCLKSKIGTIVFGWNKENKLGINIGKSNNQNFVQLPLAKLKNRIAQLCLQYGLRFVETEESYTSRSSFLDNAVLPTYGEKPNRWQSLGKRVKRGLYRTAKDWLVNADANGAANILRKVATRLGLDLTRVSRGCLTQPTRFNV